MTDGPPAVTRLVWLWGPVLAYMALIFYQSSMPVAPLPSAMPDWVAHGLGYGLLGALVARAIAGGFPRPLSLAGALMAFAIAAVYGASDELHQSFVPGRTADIRDLIADATGAALAVLAVRACAILWSRGVAYLAAPRDL